MLIQTTESGFYCPLGDFYIDPRRPVPRAVITHAHSDHARGGCGRYYATRSSEPLLRKRLGTEIELAAQEYGAAFTLGNAKVSFHPAGHILGSAQVRVEAGGEVWVVSGDYKRDPDPTCEPFEPVVCDTFITEATFALPVYHWPKTSELIKEIHDWWMANRANGVASLLFCYSLGKAQRVLGGLRELADRPVLLHGAVAPLTEIYRESGIEMIDTMTATTANPGKAKRDFSQDLIVAPPGANGTPWMKRFGKCASAFCSGWMQVRGNRRRRGHDRGFALSDHADWEGLIRTIEETGAGRVLATHGRADVLVRYLQENGYDASEVHLAPREETSEIDEESAD